MPIKIIADYRELLIDIFFGIIIVVGFDRFLRDFVPEHISELNSTSTMIDSFFFFTAYFWVISHWIFYHELVTKYPYYRWRKFFVDIILFSIMFVIVNISFSAADRPGNTFVLVLLLLIWYSFACIWHLSDRGLRPLCLYLWLHFQRVMTYVGLLSLLLFLYDLPEDVNVATLIIDAYVSRLFSLLLFPYDVLEDPLEITLFPSYWYGAMLTVILAMILWNVDRLRRFLHSDKRFYLCKYISDTPQGNTRTEGQLELYRYPIKEKLGDSGEKDRVRFKSDKLCEGGPPTKIEIEVEYINKSSIEKGAGNDLQLQIDCKCCSIDGTIREDIKVLRFDLNDKIIASVQEGIEALCERNKRGDSSSAFIR
jgi:hypothetical protein